MILKLVLPFIGAAMTIAASLFLRPQTLSEKRYLIAPPPKLEYFSFGYQMVMADGLWIRSIQDFDYCENQIEKNQCQNNGWLSEMLDTVTDLAPDYLIAYKAGGLALTVIISDYAGASRIFDKGVKVFPRDRDLLYRAAYHAMVEEKDLKKAGDLFVRTAEVSKQSDAWFYSLATRLYSDAGQKELALELYKKLQGEDIEQGTLRRIRSKLGLPEPTNTEIESK